MDVKGGGGGELKQIDLKKKKNSIELFYSGLSSFVQ